MTEADLSSADLHDLHYRKGWELAKVLLLIDGKRAGLLTPFARSRFRKAARHFESALAIHPTGWSSMWALGKICQRLGEFDQALTWFSRAHSIEPGQPDVAREAGLAALETNEPERAKVFLEAAIRARPEDPGLVANLALAQLLSGSVDDAQHSASEAVARAPQDQISRRVLGVVQKVRAGRFPMPKSMVEVTRMSRWWSWLGSPLS